MRKYTFVFALFLVACGPSEKVATPTISVQPSIGPDAYPGPYPGQSSPAGATDEERFIGETPTFSGRIAFHSNRAGALQLYVIDGSDGSSQLLSTNAVQAYEPAWSPDCRSIIYSHESAGNGESELYLFQGNDIAPRPFLADSRPTTLEWSAAWSPSKSLVAFQTNPETLLQVCFADELGNSRGCLARSGYSDAHPSLSSDSAQMAFISNRDGDWEVYLSSMDNLSQAQQLTDNRVVDLHPQLSPNGEFIVFESNRTGNYDVYVMKVDGTGVVQLTSDGEDDREPTWMGNDQIVFTSHRLNDWELYMIGRDGSELTRITYQIGDDKGPAWCETN